MIFTYDSDNINDNEKRKFQEDRFGDVAVNIRNRAQAVIPIDRVIYRKDYLLNGTSFSMNVNGSVTPVAFSQTMPANETWFLTELSIFIEDSGNPASIEFGDLPALTNGILLQLSVGGVNYQIANIIDNAGLSLLFDDNFFTPGSNNGFFNNNDLFIGSMAFEIPIELRPGDSIRAIVRDNLSTIDILRIRAKFWRVL